MRAWLTWLRQAWTLVVFLVGHANEVYTLIGLAATILNRLDRLEQSISAASPQPVSPPPAREASERELLAWVSQMRPILTRLTEQQTPPARDPKESTLLSWLSSSRAAMERAFSQPAQPAPLFVRDPLEVELLAWLAAARERITARLCAPVTTEAPQHTMRNPRRERVVVEKPQPPTKQQASPHVL